MDCLCVIRRARLFYIVIGFAVLGIGALCWLILLQPVMAEEKPDLKESGKVSFSLFTPDAKKNPSLSLQVDWESDPSRPGVVSVRSWKIGDHSAGQTLSQVAEKLVFSKVEVGATAKIDSKSQYYFLVTSMSDPARSWNALGEADIDGETVSCGYHEVEAKFTILFSRDKSFEFDITAVNKAGKPEIKVANTTREIAEGTIRIRITRPTTATKWYVQAVGMLGTKSFGQTAFRQHGNWRADHPALDALDAVPIRASVVSLVPSL